MSGIFDERRCELGEGAHWHPERGQLFWFDILGKRLLTQDASGPREWSMGEMVSAAGWTSRDELLIASETALFRFNLETAVRTDVVALEADRPGTRSNDGRADPQGGFWIGTMGKRGGQDPKLGSFWRFYRGELRQVYKDITITNALSFSPDAKTMYFTDTMLGKVMRVGLDALGWPVGTPETYLDFSAQGIHPDGAVVDADGLFWNAQWGAARVAAYAPDGSFVRAVEFDAPHTSCPAFGGADGRTLFCTTALQDMSDAAKAKHPDAGKVFAAAGVALGQREHQVIL